ncbi:stage III sporulation protein AF [Lacrimispora sp. NSJ-141]|uniref:Stage III sporulation protein AF n=1 Tax=Lientehia hominis TaxID=2897778 RepID=A0AAP2RI19_9FIRM|nr:stage III sporulation protein AF [Lientehia hominis]MCD2492614.1 stage III sporulation protein AF [Lientehia hominis]
MLAGFYQWVKNIAAYLIFMSLVLKLLPEGKNVKYIKYFMGMVLVLIVLAPVGKLFRLEDVFSQFETELESQGREEEFREELELKGEEYSSSVISQYEEELAYQVSESLAAAGCGNAAVRVNLDTVNESETFGQVISIEVDFTMSERASKDSGETGSIDPVVIEKRKVKILDEDGGEEGDEAGEGEEMEKEPGENTRNYREEAEDETIRKLLSEKFSAAGDSIHIRR